MSYLQFTVCPYCGQRHDRVSGVTKKGTAKREPRPNDGDATLCFACGRWNIFDDGSDGGLRKATTDEIEALRNDPMAGAVAEAWLLAFRKREAKP